jgi:hypothetical protein
MNIYHYDKNKYSELLTLELQNNLTKEEKIEWERRSKFRQEPYSYYQHISFFIDPIPSEILGDFYPKDHHSWAKGNQLWEYVVNIDDLNIKSWIIVESPLKRIIEDFLPWIENDTYKQFYFKILNTARFLNNERGNDLESLKKQLPRFKGLTKDAYLKLKDHPNFKNMVHMYAPTVPHLFIYTDYPVTQFKTQQIKIGSSRPFLEHTMSIEQDLILSEFTSDLELYFNLQEAVVIGGVFQGNFDINGISQRTESGKDRISGLDQLEPTIIHIYNACREGGWVDGDKVYSDFSENSYDSGLDSNEYAIRNSIAKTKIYFSTKNPNAELAQQTFYDKNLPKNSILFENGHNELIVTVRYLSDGTSRNAKYELIELLREYGVEIIGD